MHTLQQPRHYDRHRKMKPCETVSLQDDWLIVVGRIVLSASMEGPRQNLTNNQRAHRHGNTTSATAPEPTASIVAHSRYTMHNSGLTARSRRKIYGCYVGEQAHESLHNIHRCSWSLVHASLSSERKSFALAFTPGQNLIDSHRGLSNLSSQHLSNILERLNGEPIHVAKSRTTTR